MYSADIIKATVTDYIKNVWNKGDIEALYNLTNTNFFYKLAGQPERDQRAMEQFITMTRVAFPDWTVKIIEIFSDNETVIVRWEGLATHKGFFQSIPPTGKHISVSGINIYRFEYGKISAEWEQMDSLGMLQQLGVL